MSRNLFSVGNDERPDSTKYSAIPLVQREKREKPPTAKEDKGTAIERSTPREKQKKRKKPDRSLTHHFPSSTDYLDIIQFTAAVYIVEADEGKIELDIMRMGRLQDHLSFDYATKGISAVAGRMFVDTRGTLRMKPGEDSTSITVPILNDPLWNPTTEFMISLSHPENCQLGMYLKVARVKIIDATPFPSNTFKDEIHRGAEGLEEINKFALFGAFVYRMWHFDDIWWKTLATLGLDQLSNVYVYIKLWASIYMVDVVFNMKDEDGLIFAHDRLKTSWYVAFLLLAPMAPIYFAEVFKIRLDIEGHLSRDFSRQIFRKFMNFTKESREDVPTTDMITAVTTDAAELTAGYGKVITMVRLAGKIAISIFFTLHKNPKVWWALLIVPIAMLAWGYFRTHVYINVIDATGNISSDVSLFVSDMLGRITLIADYQQRPQINTLFSERVEQLRQVKVPETSTLQTNMFIPQLIGPALVAFYTAVGAELVLAEELKLGVFLATLSVFGEICDAFSEAFGLAMEVISILDPLRDMTELLNKPIDPPIWKRVDKARRERTKELRHDILEDRKMGHMAKKDLDIPRRDLRDAARDAKFKEQGAPMPFIPAADELKIQFEHVTFNYQQRDPIPGFEKAHIVCPQGVICSVLGPPHSGRKTLLELISNKIFPTHGSIFVPSHLRILYVSAEPAMFNLSVWDNIIFGNKEGHNPYRIENILKNLEMDLVLDMVKEDMADEKIEYDKGEGRQPIHAKAVSPNENPLMKLSRTELTKIHLCRAFVMNPEVMVLHRPFMHYSKKDPDAYHDIVDALCGHRDQRGYLMPADSTMSRRPRTVFYTPDTLEEEEIADVAWIIPGAEGGGIRMVPYPAKQNATLANPSNGKQEFGKPCDKERNDTADSKDALQEELFQTVSFREREEKERAASIPENPDAEVRESSGRQAVPDLTSHPAYAAYTQRHGLQRSGSRQGSCFTDMELPALNIWHSEGSQHKGVGVAPSAPRQDG